MSVSESSPVKPWYRQFWFWLVMSPLIVVVPASFTLLTLAILHSDDRVIDNYYKHGRMINASLEQDERARLWQMSAQLQLEAGRVQIELTTSTPYPPALSLWLDHPFEADRDQFLTLERQADGRYLGELPVSTGDWYLTLTPATGRDERTQMPWRLRGELTLAPGNQQQTLKLQASPRE